MSSFRARRSCLYMPGSNARALAKAASLPADVLILDLEDAVAPEAKSEARSRVCAFLDEGAGERRETVVRINALSTPWGADDLRDVLLAQPDAVLVPKVSAAFDVEGINDRMADAPEEIALWAMVETPAAVLNCAAIAAMSTRTRLAALVAGANDLAKDMHVQVDALRTGLTFALSTVVTAARAHDLAVIDGVFNDISDLSGLRAECEQGRHFGFDGKTLIHPAQIDAANTIFAPSEDELLRARAIIEAFARLENAAKGVLKVNGEMVERLHLEEARQLLAFREAITNSVTEGAQVNSPDS